MKRILLALGCVFLVIPNVTLAFLYQWIPGAQDNPVSVSGYNVIEYMNAGSPSGGNNQWHLSNPGSDSGNGLEMLWLMGSAGNFADVDLTKQSTAVAFMMHGNGNDGYADFYVDSTYICTRDMYISGYNTLIVYDLSLLAHELKVVQNGSKNPLSSANHLHVLGGGALESQSVPDAGSTLVLLSLIFSGTVGLKHYRRMIS